MTIKKSQIEKWIAAQKRHRLSDTHVQMARELGLNPDKLGKIDNHRQEPWKAPLPEFIEEIFYKRFKKERPDVVKPLKQILKEQEIKTKTKKKEKQLAYMNGLRKTYAGSRHFWTSMGLTVPSGTLPKTRWWMGTFISVWKTEKWICFWGITQMPWRDSG